MYPKYYPDNCPLDDNQPIENNSAVYRFVRKLSISYLRNHIERDDVSGDETEIELCKKCALSVFTNLNKMNRFRFKFPASDGWQISKIVMSDQWGRIGEPDSNSHCNWWVPDAITKEEILENMELVK